MAFEQGVRIWRYKAASNQWVYRTKSADRASRTMAASEVHLPDGGQVSDGTFLFERIDPKNDTLATQSGIRPQDVIKVVPKRLVPDKSDIFWWSGPKDGKSVADKDIHRIYVRRGNEAERAERKRDQRAMIKAAMPSNADGDYIVMVQDETNVLYFKKGTDIVNQQLSLRQGQVAQVVADEDNFDHGAFLTMVSYHLYKNRSKLEGAFECAADDPDTAAAVILEVFKGATPSPTQGHNVLHSLTGVLDDIDKMHQVVSCNTDAADASGFSGDFGAGVGAVDGAWQAVGSYLTYISDVVNAIKIFEMDKSTRQDLAGANARKRAIASAAQSALKFSATTFKLTDGINQIATGASSAFALTGPAAAMGGLASAATAARSFHQVRKSNIRLQALKAAEDMQRLENPGDVEISEKTQKLLNYALKKTRRKRNVKFYEGGVATVGTLGSIALIAGGIAAANLWNPIGWGIGVAVFVAGAGMLGYKIWRKFGAKKKIERKDFPRLLVGRYLHLCVHHKPGGMRSARTKNRRALELSIVEAMLQSYGVEPYRCLFPTEIPNLEKRIARHLKS